MLINWKLPASILLWFTITVPVVTTANAESTDRIDIHDSQFHKHHEYHPSQRNGGDTRKDLIGIIESCSGWSLNKLPILRSFIKDGEAECYKNIFVQFIPNMKPVLVLYSMSHAHDTTSSNNNDNHDHKDVHNDDNSNRNSNNDIDTMKKRMVEVERIPLHEYASKDALHTLFWNLGFTKKSHEEQQHVLENAQQMQYNERLQYHIRLEYYKWRTIYVNDFRTQVMGMTVEAYQEQTKFQRLTCHPSGPIPDMLNDHYDRINRNIAGAYKEDRYLYAVRYLENLATSTGTTKQ